MVNKLVKAVFGEYQATAGTPFGQAVLHSLDEKKRLALQLALVGGACYIKPCPVDKGFSFTLVPRNQVLIFQFPVHFFPVLQKHMCISQEKSPKVQTVWKMAT